jgi:ABC-2 type transport system ATP-binding protein
VYGDGTHALDALELRVPEGCFFGLLGPNGAGKTTLIGAIAGLVRAPAGKVFVFGHDAVSDPRARLSLGLAPSSTLRHERGRGRTGSRAGCAAGS